MRLNHSTSQLGVTLVELVMVLAIFCVTVGLALPSMDQLRSRTHLRSVSGQLKTDLQLARSTAVSLNREVQISFDQTAGGSCYVLHTGRPHTCSCVNSGVAHCTGDAVVLRTVQVATHSGVTLTSNSRHVGFEPLRGMVTPTARFLHAVDPANRSMW